MNPEILLPIASVLFMILYAVSMWERDYPVALAMGIIAMGAVSCTVWMQFG